MLARVYNKAPPPITTVVDKDIATRMVNVLELFKSIPMDSARSTSPLACPSGLNRLHRRSVDLARTLREAAAQCTQSMP